MERVVVTDEHHNTERKYGHCRTVAASIIKCNTVVDVSAFSLNHLTPLVPQLINGGLKSLEDNSSNKDPGYRDNYSKVLQIGLSPIAGAAYEFHISIEDDKGNYNFDKIKRGVEIVFEL